jgi:hypothetical protein
MTTRCKQLCAPDTGKEVLQSTGLTLGQMLCLTILDEFKVSGWTHGRHRWNKRESTGNTMQQADVKMIKKLMKAYTHKLRGSYIQHIPVAGGQVIDCNVRWVMGLC